jgi:hypothetical protein
MAKRKYVRIGETPKAYQCTRKTCGWQGTLDQKKIIELEKGYREHVCPVCYNTEFYGLLEKPTIKTNNKNKYNE